MSTANTAFLLATPIDPTHVHNLAQCIDKGRTPLYRAGCTLATAALNSMQIADVTCVGYVL